MTDIIMDSEITKKELRAKRETYLEILELCVSGLNYVGRPQFTYAFKSLITELTDKIERIDQSLETLYEKGEE